MNMANITTNEQLTSLRERALAALRVVSVRLRFLAVLAVVFVVVGEWEALKTYWDALSSRWLGAATAPGAVAGDTEYFCPMDPGVVSDWPEKCPVCNMALVRRRRGDATPLPNGVVARMQLSPYRIQLAGIKTAPIEFRPLARPLEVVGVLALDDRRARPVVAPADGVVASVAGSEWSTVRDGEPVARLRVQGEPAEVPIPAPIGGKLADVAVRAGQAIRAGDPIGVIADPTRLRLEAECSEADFPFLEAGRAASVTADALPGRGPFAGRVEAVRPGRPDGSRGPRVVIAVEDPEGLLLPGLSASARVEVPAAEIEPFRSSPSDPPTFRKGEPRAYCACPDHPDKVATKAGRCPLDGKVLDRQTLADHQRLRWWCPMHPKVTADEPGHKCEECGGMVLVPRVVAFRPRGQVLSVPESAVVDTGTQRLVYVEGMPGMFDGVEVRLGPRCGDDYPVIAGLEAGQRVAIAGAFLIDAETRLNPALAAGYFGSSKSAATSPPPPTPIASAPSEANKTCPVSGKPLGSMGEPVRVVVDGRAVLLCCSGCEPALRRDPAKYLGGARP
ncbi:MAG TPA: heavy metal-binding domain-containing protein [Isosphaeraceae bacterium]|jgi:multidrug efflux pump subunit AcrA (membrane-fusion protein)|nr:heavy metal-binding domain-containing protein [Isosphaeraceae bacterium]